MDFWKDWAREQEQEVIRLTTGNTAGLDSQSARVGNSQSSGTRDDVIEQQRLRKKANPGPVEVKKTENAKAMVPVTPVKPVAKPTVEQVAQPTVEVATALFPPASGLAVRLAVVTPTTAATKVTE